MNDVHKTLTAKQLRSYVTTLWGQIEALNTQLSEANERAEKAELEVQKWRTYFIEQQTRAEKAESERDQLLLDLAEVSVSEQQAQDQVAALRAVLEPFAGLTSVLEPGHRGNAHIPTTDNIRMARQALADTDTKESKKFSYELQQAARHIHLKAPNTVSIEVGKRWQAMEKVAVQARYLLHGKINHWYPATVALRDALAELDALK